MSQTQHTLVPFVILFTGRTGSSYLTSTIRSHPEVHATGEELVHLLRKNRFDEVRDFMVGKVAQGYRASGFKTKFTDVDDWASFAELLKGVNARVIHLDRRNRIKHAVSFFTGQRLYEATGHWNLYQEGQRIPTSIHIDFADFDTLLKKKENERAKLHNHLINLELSSLLLYYEDMLVFENNFLKMMFNFLGFSQYPLSGKCSKNTSDDLRKVIENFDELRAHYAGTVYEPMFDEVLISA